MECCRFSNEGIDPDAFLWNAVNSLWLKIGCFDFADRKPQVAIAVATRGFEEGGANTRQHIPIRLEPQRVIDIPFRYATVQMAVDIL